VCTSAVRRVRMAFGTSHQENENFPTRRSWRSGYGASSAGIGTGVSFLFVSFLFISLYPVFAGVTSTVLAIRFCFLRLLSDVSAWIFCGLWLFVALLCLRPRLTLMGLSWPRREAARRWGTLCI
jgi:hypothetical protein